MRLLNKLRGKKSPRCKVTVEYDGKMIITGNECVIEGDEEKTVITIKRHPMSGTILDPHLDTDNWIDDAYEDLPTTPKPKRNDKDHPTPMDIAPIIKKPAKKKAKK